MQRFREQLLEVGYKQSPGEQNDRRADSSLDLSFGVMKKYPYLCARAVCELAKATDKFRPDIIFPVPDRATGYGRSVGLSRGIGSICLGRNPSTQEVYFRGSSQEAVGRYQRIVIMDDVIHDATDYSEVFALPGIAERTVAVVSLWNQRASSLALEVPEGISVASVIHETIPEQSEYRVDLV